MKVSSYILAMVLFALLLPNLSSSPDELSVCGAGWCADVGVAGFALLTPEGPRACGGSAVSAQ